MKSVANNPRKRLYHFSQSDIDSPSKCLFRSISDVEQASASPHHEQNLQSYDDRSKHPTPVSVAMLHPALSPHQMSAMGSPSTLTTVSATSSAPSPNTDETPHFGHTTSSSTLNTNRLNESTIESYKSVTRCDSISALSLRRNKQRYHCSEKDCIEDEKTDRVSYRQGLNSLWALADALPSNSCQDPGEQASSPRDALAEISDTDSDHSDTPYF